jgi:hypothetical protein
MLRTHLSHPIRKRRDYSVTVFQPAGIRLERPVIGEIIQAKSASTRAPLTVASYCDNEGPVGGIEQLIRNEIGMGIPPPRGIFARDKDILRDVHECGTSAVRE